MSMIAKQHKATRRKLRVRAKISGTAARPRISVHTSLRSMFVQLIDDASGRTLVSARDREAAEKGTKVARAAALGKLVAEKSAQAGIKNVVFDRGKKQYHGRVAALAGAMREHGLQF